ncbi:MAG: type II toxin-antitoxin system RelE/ParE family toxin [Actinobacteria bacterium]|nr:type II toxin-antitoxin system RelE/ParE family toxin [Actinomycetota bacterium]
MKGNLSHSHLTNYSIAVKRKAQKYLRTIPKKDRLRIVGVIELIREIPLPPKSLKLTSRDAYRIRIGEYRIIFSFNSKRLTILVIKIGHRKNIYQIDSNSEETRRSINRLCICT